jgi:hypothetical protein
MREVNKSAESAIWDPIIGPVKSGLPPAAARAFLELTFRERDMTRMSELAEKNNAGDFPKRSGGNW